MSDQLIIFPQPIQPGTGAPSARPAGNKAVNGDAFARELDAQLKTGGLTFSRHAASRMESRGISFSAEEMNRLATAVEQAGAKGARESLVLLDSTALIVSIKNSTVVTVADTNTLKGNVFTNIDSAVIA